MTNMMDPKEIEKQAEKKMESMGLKDYDELFDNSLPEVIADVREGLKEKKDVDTSDVLDVIA